MAIAVDASTPAFTVINTAAAALAGASFSPPAGSLIVTVFASSRVATVNSLSDNKGGGLTNSRALSSSTASTDAGSAIWVSDCASSQSGMIVTVNLSATIRGTVGIIVLTGAALASAQTGAHFENFAFTSAPSGNVTTTANGSMVLAAFGSRSGGTSPTVPGGQTLVFNSITFSGGIAGTGGDIQWTQWTGANTATSGTSVTINDTNTTDFCVATAEILAAAAAPVVILPPQRSPLGV